MNNGEFAALTGAAVGSTLPPVGGSLLLAAEVALGELRDLEWRAKVEGRSLGRSPWAGDGPWSLGQREAGDWAGEFSDTLVVNEAGKEVVERKRDSLRPRAPLSVAEVARYELLLGWLDKALVRDKVPGEVIDATDKRILWEAGFHIWRGEPFDWAAIARRIGYRRSQARLGGHYREALARWVCAVNGVPARHFRALLARESGYFNSAARQESLGFGAVKW